MLLSFPFRAGLFGQSTVQVREKEVEIILRRDTPQPFSKTINDDYSEFVASSYGCDFLVVIHRSMSMWLAVNEPGSGARHSPRR